MERSVPNSNSTVLIEIIGFDGPLLVHLEARTAELLSLTAPPKPLLLNNLEARVGFEPTYRGFADLEKLTNNSFTFRVVVFCSVSFRPHLVRSQWPWQRKAICTTCRLERNRRRRGRCKVRGET